MEVTRQVEELETKHQEELKKERDEVTRLRAELEEAQKNNAEVEQLKKEMAELKETHAKNIQEVTEAAARELADEKETFNAQLEKSSDLLKKSEGLVDELVTKEEMWLAELEKINDTITSKTFFFLLSEVNFCAEVRFSKLLAAFLRVFPQFGWPR